MAKTTLLAHALVTYPIYDVGSVALLEQTPLDLAALTSTYDRLQAWNFSHEFLSRIPEHLVVTRADDLGWSDWGTPEAIERSFAAIGMVPPWRGPAEAVG